MTDRESLIAEICEIGLFIDDRGNIYGERYEPFVRHGRGIWQHPEELADLLLLVKSRGVRKFLNVGTFNGRTFNFMADYLTRHGAARCISVDPIDHAPLKRPEYEYVSGTTEYFAGQAFDLVFIDGHHGYAESSLDYENVGRHAKVCAFHDIDDSFIAADQSLDGGVCRLWREIKAARESVEFVAAGKTVQTMGIGVLL